MLLSRLSHQPLSRRKMKKMLSLSSELIGFTPDDDTHYSKNEEIDTTSTTPSFNFIRSSRRSGATLLTEEYPLISNVSSATTTRSELKPTAISSIAPIKKLYDSKHEIATNRFTTSADYRGYIPGASYTHTC
jgi:hypothetical protein